MVHFAVGGCEKRVARAEYRADAGASGGVLWKMWARLSSAPPERRKLPANFRGASPKRSRTRKILCMTSIN